jgi:hypothetical protein
VDRTSTRQPVLPGDHSASLRVAAAGGSYAIAAALGPCVEPGNMPCFSLWPPSLGRHGCKGRVRGDGSLAALPPVHVTPAVLISPSLPTMEDAQILQRSIQSERSTARCLASAAAFRVGDTIVCDVQSLGPPATPRSRFLKSAGEGHGPRGVISSSIGVLLLLGLLGCSHKFGLRLHSKI